MLVKECHFLLIRTLWIWNPLVLIIAYGGWASYYVFTFLLSDNVCLAAKIAFLLRTMMRTVLSLELPRETPGKILWCKRTYLILFIPLLISFWKRYYFGCHNCFCLRDVDNCISSLFTACRYFLCIRDIFSQTSLVRCNPFSSNCQRVVYR